MTISSHREPAENGEDRGTEAADLDLEQDIARSAFADMILDDDRNERYRTALRTVVAEKHASGESANVVDIGTGSGLLSLAAADVGADRVTAVEMFAPVADIAKQIFLRSKFADKIQLIKSRSTDLNAGENLPPLGNIIVAEVFDTELIGEGALRTFKEAHGTLVESGSRVIPSSARVWLLPVESAEFRKFNRHPAVLQPRRQTPKTPTAAFGGASRCGASTALFDFQMSELRPGVDFRPLCAPFVAFHFNFEDPDSIRYEESVVHKFMPSARDDGDGENVGDESVERQFDCVFLWWDLDMDGTGGNRLTMAPTWIDAESAWRDHWMQAAYFLPHAPHPVRPGEEVALRCSHDEYAFQFSIADSPFVVKNVSTSHNDALPSGDAEISQSSVAACLLHSVSARSAFYRMNQLEETQNRFLPSLLDFCEGKSIICVGEGSPLGLYAAQVAERVTLVEPDNFFQQILSAAAKSHQKTAERVRLLQSVVGIGECVCTSPADATTIGIVSEPYFLSSILPTNNIRRYRDELRRVRELFSEAKWAHASLDCFIRTMEVKALPVRFENLWKTVANVGTTLGFDLSPFNDVYQRARRNADNCVEAFPLWEYPSTATGPPQLIHRFQFDASSSDFYSHQLFQSSSPASPSYSSTEPESPNTSAAIQAEIEGTNAIVLWTEFEYSSSSSSSVPTRSSSGLLEGCRCAVGAAPQWQRGHWQGVYFLAESEWRRQEASHHDNSKTHPVETVQGGPWTYQVPLSYFPV